MKARGKREAHRPWGNAVRAIRPERPKYICSITRFQRWTTFIVCYQGRRASRLLLAFVFRAFGADYLARCSKVGSLVPQAKLIKCISLKVVAIESFVGFKRWLDTPQNCAEFLSRAVGTGFESRFRVDL